MSERRVMIVEDEVMVSMHLAGIVERLGHQVVGTAEDSKEALLLGTREQPELVLMDIHLAGGGDGVTTALQLVGELECAIIFITAYADDATVQRTQEIGAAGYLVKPFTESQVRAAITTAFASHARLQREREQSKSLGGALKRVGGALFLIDPNDEVTFANQSAASLVGWPVYKVFGRSIYTVLHADEGALRAALARARASDSPEDTEIVVTDDGNVTRTVRITIESVPVDDGDLKGAVLSLAPIESEVLVDAADSGEARTKLSPFGSGTRLLVYSHDTFGLGHLRRCMAIIRRLCSDYPGLSVLLVTGSPLVHRNVMPKGADYVKLPALQKTGAEAYQARSLQIPSTDIQALRGNLILHTVRDYQPNVLLVDHSPTGGKGELLPALEWIREAAHCQCILGLRDIIDDPVAVRALWREQGMYELLENHYQHILVYGTPTLFDPVSEYAFTANLRARTTYVDYICSAEGDEAPPALEASSAPLVFVTIGGGDGGAESVLLPFLDMMESFAERIEFRAVVVTGPLADAQVREQCTQRAASLPVEVHDFLPTTRHLLEAAEVTISTAGYNTCTDVLSFAQRSILIPRAMYRQEQTLRAREFARLGLCTHLDPKDVTAESLFNTIQEVRAKPGLGKGPALPPPLDGTRKLSRFFADLQVSVHSPGTVGSEPAD